MFPKIGVFPPKKRMVKIMEHPINPWMIWGENPPFKETSKYRESHPMDITPRKPPPLRTRATCDLWMQWYRFGWDRRSSYPPEFNDGDVKVVTPLEVTRSATNETGTWLPVVGGFSPTQIETYATVKLGSSSQTWGVNIKTYLSCHQPDEL